MQLSNSWVCLSSLDKQTTASTVSLDNRGLAYGDGFFTTMGVLNGQILWADYHHQRLISHAKALQFNLDAHALLATLKTYATQLQQGMLKLIITRAAQATRGYGYTFNKLGSTCEIWLKSSTMTIGTAEQLSLGHDILIPVQPMSTTVCLSSQVACLPPSLAGLKSLNRLDNVLASAELQDIKARSLISNGLQEISEGLLRDMTGCWIEGTMSNMFYQLSESTLEESSRFPHYQDYINYLSTGQWYTPSMTQSGVAGVMRQVIIDGLSTGSHPVVIRSLQDKDLPQLSKLFFCNALRGIMPMSSLTLLSGEVISLEAI
ncbi:aminotransferase class IV [Psychrobacter sp.]|uniref:aminotransferase class IV n=1 Tax=Psychrobacter sp. TaxID=56811 RepID=UPI003569B368